MEKQLVIELCKLDNSRKDVIQKALKENIDYSYVLGQLHMHRMAGTAYYVLQKHELLSEVNREFRNSLRATYIHNTYWLESFRRALYMLAEILEKQIFSYATLKGGVLVNQYPSGVRTSNDIDLLVLRKDIPKVSSCLEQAGFVQGFIRNERIQKATRNEIVNAQLNRGEIIPFVKKIGLRGMEFLEVDINVSLDEKPVHNSQIIKQMLDNRKIINVEDKCLYTLNEEDFFIQLCKHLYKEASVYQWVSRGQDISLYKFLDIYKYLDYYQNPTTVKKLVEEIKKYNFELECYYAIYYTGVIFGMEKSKTILGQFDRGKSDYKDFDIIYNYSNGKKFIYQEDYLVRLFDCNRIEKLKELADE